MGCLSLQTQKYSPEVPWCLILSNVFHKDEENYFFIHEGKYEKNLRKKLGYIYVKGGWSGPLWTEFTQMFFMTFLGQ